MYKHSTIENVLQNLHTVASENSVALRKAALCQYVKNINDEKEADLVSLILSFQVLSIFSAPKPRFNTIEFGSLTSALRLWFDTRDHNKTPYMAQGIIYFMSSASKIGLSTGHVAECLGNYVDPYEWLAENQIVLNPPTESQACKLCNLNATHEDICQECMTNLAAFTEYRCSDFTLTIDSVVCPWLVDTNLGYGLFSFNYGSYHIERVGLISVAFTRIEGLGDRVQGQLPFEEYQKPIN